MTESINVCIPYLDKGKNSNELRFALRSIEKYLTGYRDIWIVGSMPAWATGLRHIPLSDSSDPRNHERNIFRKCMAVWENEEIGGKVLHYHADHLLLSDYVASEFPYYWHRTLLQGAQENQGAYRTTLIRTDKLLRSMMLPVKDFDCHCPIVYERKRFIEAFRGVEWREYGYGVKSIYANFWEIEGVQCTDLKLTGRRYKDMQGRIEGRSWFSTGNSNPEIERFLSSLFPKKSRYEK